MKTLVIVESPSKAGTISKILGKGYYVTSSYGHIRDLAKDGKGNTGVDIEHNYTPHYVVPQDKKNVVKELKKQVKTHDQVLLATDEDREGEAISWHLYDELKLSKETARRITFTEITPEAITHAVAHPRDVNIHLVEAQQARRILDRLVGFELTSLLWKKVRGQLSAGRVQSVAVRLLVDREREIAAFTPIASFKVTAEFMTGSGVSLPAELSKNLPSEADAQTFLLQCINQTFHVHAVDVKPSLKQPSPPFTTSTLQQIAGQKLGFSVSRTMSAAQKLYEAGHITYMRTDSTSLSGSARDAIRSFILKEYGDAYSKPTQYASRSKNAQEAHEAIRPTYIQKIKVADNPDQARLYELIRAQTLASQMSPARVERTAITIHTEPQTNPYFVAKGEVVLFDGYLKAYSHTKWYAHDDTLLPQLQVGDPLSLQTATALERHSKPPARYSEATLVKKLEELGVGRPSTYAPTIAKITSPNRGYITRETREGTPTAYITLTLAGNEVKRSETQEVTGTQKNKLFASDMGAVVTDFLSTHFPDVMDYAFTAEVEDKLDDIAQGKAQWAKVLDHYYKPFSQRVATTQMSAERATGERILGKHPDSGRTVLVRVSKYGPVVQIGLQDELADEEKPQYANLLQNQSIETITLEEALTLFTLPRVIGNHDGLEISVGRGRFGPYIKYADTYISIRGKDPITLTMEEALDFVRQKQEELKPVGHYEGDPIIKGAGRFGPYVKWRTTYASISKKSGISLETITEQEAIQLIADKVKKDQEKLLHSWDDGAITLQVGRWGPIIRVKGKRTFYKVPRGDDGKPMATEALAKLTGKQLKKLLK